MNSTIKCVGQTHGQMNLAIKKGKTICPPPLLVWGIKIKMSSAVVLFCDQGPVVQS